MAAVVLVAGAVIATVVAGTQPWFDYPALLGRVIVAADDAAQLHARARSRSRPASRSPSPARIQVVATVGALAAVVIASRTSSAEASYLVAVVASQLISPLLWDHYAMLLLLPVAWLLERRQWWAVAIPLATVDPARRDRPGGRLPGRLRRLPRRPDPRRRPTTAARRDRTAPDLDGDLPITLDSAR